MLHALLNPGLVGIVALFLSIVWMLRDEKDRTRPLLVLALVINLFYGWLLTVVMGKEDGLVPWKFDSVLAVLDQALGVPWTLVANGLNGDMRIPLRVVYELMVPMMVAWFLVAREGRASGSLVLAYVSEMVTGPIFYAIVPACGPAYAFGRQWLSPGMVQPAVTRLSGMPNAFPSLHIATAFVFVLFAPRRRWRIVSVLFLFATALATLSTGEHYVIDLVAGLAFGCQAAAVGKRHLGAALAFGALALGWSLAVRFGFAVLIAHTALLRGLALFTLSSAALAVMTGWREKQTAPALRI